MKASGRITYIDIDDYTIEESELNQKSIKNDSSRRFVPIHDRLIGLGFGDYLKALAALGHTRLFPNLALNQFDKRTKEASRAANRYIDAHVSKDPAYVSRLSAWLQGFRPQGGLSERVVDRICGQAPTTVAGKYGNGVRLPSLYASLHRIDWSFMDWDDLSVATPN